MRLGTWRTLDIVVPGVVEYFGKEYVWMRDVEGLVFLAKWKDGVPDLL